MAFVQDSMTEMKKDFDFTLGKNSYLYISVFPTLGVGKNYYHLPQIEEMSFPDEEFKKREELQKLRSIVAKKGAESKKLAQEKREKTLLATLKKKYE